MSFIFISLISDSSDDAEYRKGGRLHGLDLSTKHVADDSREPEIEKATG
ncbi:hypothetical protein CIH91_004364 [Salmonella enterica]|nr:hypothetical protein [Salmonella enterica subsp. houtenae serovar 50:z4,z23:-]EDQ1075797.1 hypothetical protein [Salmonella enterica]EDV3253330.1 hypothetical protein [Salmonella enterica subsp. houtenae]EEE1667687.1 hypothetical protein [Salmonella enterica subsp. houtenae serovar 48:z4,z32:-]HAE7876094.1 hypothetical protein [Salmonella enterica subsp. enterica serovar 1,9,12:-:-]